MMVLNLCWAWVFARMHDARLYKAKGRKVAIIRPAKGRPFSFGIVGPHRAFRRQIRYQWSKAVICES